ncbi:MAG: HlyD family efflux transporter periplasmic adaptor subunit [Algiphilus sp.]
MTAFTHLRFIGRVAPTPQPSGTVIVEAQANGARYRLSDDEYRMAQLFDGTRDRAARMQAAGDSEGDVLIDRLALELSEAGLLEAGSEEPLPTPPQMTEDGAPPSGAPEQHPASSTPGSLAGPGLPGDYGSAASRERGGAAGGIAVPIGPLRFLGRLINLFVGQPLLRWLLWLAGIAAVGALWHLRDDAAVHITAVLSPYWIALVGLPSALAINLLSSAARAAAIERWTAEPAPVRLRFALGFLPHLHVDTEGPAERADLPGRLRILGSTLQCGVLLFVLGVSGWLMLRTSGELLATYLLVFAIIAAVGTLLRANPLVPREGYLLLAHRLGVPDLRDQAWMATFGWNRPWARAAPPPRRALRLFAALALLYIIAVIVLILAFPARWLGMVWGGVGVAVVLAALLFVIVAQIRRVRSQRRALAGTWGHKGRAGPPSRRTVGWLALIALVMVLPYRYDASGKLTVLPAERAEVHALAAGDVREVFVAEGDQVQAGDEIARLYDAAQRAEVAMAKAEVSRLQAQLALEQAGARSESIALAEQRVATAEARLKAAATEARRAEAAYERNGISAQDYERAISNAQVRREELKEAQGQLEVTQGGIRPERLDALQAQLEAEQAELAFHEQRLQDTRLRAPISGTVVSDQLRHARGKYLDIGDRIATIEQQTQMLAELEVPEAQIAIVEQGADARVRIWSQPTEVLPARVLSIAPNAEEAPYGRVVRVTLAVEDPDGRLRSEMTGRGKVDGVYEPVIVVFSKAIVRFVLVEVWSWLP